MASSSDKAPAAPRGAPAPLFEIFMRDANRVLVAIESPPAEDSEHYKSFQKRFVREVVSIFHIHFALSY